MSVVMHMMDAFTHIKIMVKNFYLASSMLIFGGPKSSALRLFVWLCPRVFFEGRSLELLGFSFSFALTYF